MEKKCEYCGNQFSGNKKSRFCSRSCSNKSRGTFKDFDKRCEFCGKLFKKKKTERPNVFKKRKFCSHDCYNKSRNTDIEKECEFCGKKFVLPRYRAEKQKYCSNACKHEAKKNGIKNNCAYCNKEIYVTPHLIEKGYGKYCGKKCYDKAQLQKKEIRCKNCGKTILVKPSRINEYGNFCSWKCYLEDIPNRPQKGYYQKCLYCGKEFYVKPSESVRGRGKYCSKDCFIKSRPSKLKIKCKMCGKFFEISPAVLKRETRGQFCSKKCVYKYRSIFIRGEKHPMFGRDGLIGVNNPNWKGGTSFLPYCDKFNEEFKERVRKFWNRKCGICNMSEKENGKKLSVHHVTYDKKTCCNTTIPLFIPLCHKHHVQTNFNRDYWEDYLSNYIMIWFDGECYYPNNSLNHKNV